MFLLPVANCPSDRQILSVSKASSRDQLTFCCAHDGRSGRSFALFTSDRTKEDVMWSEELKIDPYRRTSPFEIEKITPDTEASWEIGDDQGVDQVGRYWIRSDADGSPLIPPCLH